MSRAKATVAQPTRIATNNFLGGTPQEADPQLSLPTGPGAVLRGGRRERTDEDRQWYSDLLRDAQHSRLTDKAVFERLAYYASLNTERVAFPSVARVAREAMVSERTVQYALRRLETAGLIECLTRKGGHATARYRVLVACTPGAQAVHPGGARGAPEGLSRSREGSLDQKQNLLTLVFDAQSKVPTATMEKPIHPRDLPSPDPDQEQDRARTPVAKEPEPVFDHPRQVAMLFALQRKLNYTANDAQAVVFDGLAHTDKKRIIDRLEAEEQKAALRGEVSAPPPKPLAPRRQPTPTPTPTPTRGWTPCALDQQHRWTAYGAGWNLHVHSVRRGTRADPGGERMSLRIEAHNRLVRPRWPSTRPRVFGSAGDA